MESHIFPDGNYIYFVRREELRAAIASLYDAPMLENPAPAY